MKKYLLGKLFFILLFFMLMFCWTGNITLWRSNLLLSKHNFRLPDPGRNMLVKIFNYSQNAILEYIIDGLIIFVGFQLFITFLMSIKKENYKLVSEIISVECFMLLCNGIIQMSTTLFPSDGTQQSCLDPDYSKFGYWIFIRISTSFCGDMIWSGHTYHVIFGTYYVWKVTKSKTLFIINSLIILFLSVGLILTRSHYTVDVLLSIIITPLLVTNQDFLDKLVSIIYHEEPEEQEDYNEQRISDTEFDIV